jgi:hypothetical protein
MIYLGLWLLVLGVSAAQAQNIMQQTYGWCSPAVGQTRGNVIINCQGVAPQANQLLNERLNRTNLALQEKTREANEFARKYHELSQQVTRINDNKLTPRVEGLLRQGELKEAEALLRSSTISMAQYQSIQPGMSYQEVVKLLGRTGVESGSAENVASYHWLNADESMVAIVFTNGQVGSKVQHGLR